MMTVRQIKLDEFFLSDSYMTSIFIVGILLSVVSQMIYEHFYLNQSSKRWLLKGVAIVLILLYGWYMHSSLSLVDDEFWFFYSIPGIRGMIVYFFLSVLLIWIPTIRQDRMKFSDSFMVSFRALYTSQFFSLVLFIGISGLIFLIEALLFSVGSSWWGNSFIVIFNFVGPMIFLSMLPKYYLIHSTDEEAIEEIEGLIKPSKFLSRLVSFIFIPLMEVYSGILILYILLNFGSGFFTDSLIEGLLLNYIIYGWVLLLLADSVESNFVGLFKSVFPFALIFVVFLQMIATINQIQKLGMTHGRYLILLLGLASIIGSVYYLMKNKSLKIIPILALITGFIAFVPPFDAMSVSVKAQVNRIEDILDRYEVNRETGKSEGEKLISSRDEDKLESSLDYLDGIQALNQLSWLPKRDYVRPMEYFDFDAASPIHPEDFWEEELPEEEIEEEKMRQTRLESDRLNLDLEGFSQLIEVRAFSGLTKEEGEIEKDGVTFQYQVDLEDGFEIYMDSDILEEMLTYDFSQAIEDLEEGRLAIEDLTFTEEIDGYPLQIIIQELEISEESTFIDFYLLF